MVSNISIMQNAREVVAMMRMRLALPCAAAYAEKSKPSVNTLPNESVPNARNASIGLSMEKEKFA